MFTGLIEAVGTVVSTEPRAEGRLLRIRAPELVPELEDGESVALDGACLTVAARDPEAGTFSVEAIRTTLSRTTLGDFAEGRRVNLERALRAGDRLGGHFVQGHVDATAEVVEVEPAEETVYVRVRLRRELAELVVPLGSLAVDGVSLTVNRLLERGGTEEGCVAELAIIPYTWSHTNFDRLEPGDRVNLEADMIAKHVRRLVEPHRAPKG